MAVGQGIAYSDQEALHSARLSILCQGCQTFRLYSDDTEQQETAANQEQESPDQPEQKRKKRGAPKGYRGATRKPPDRAPDRTVLVNPCQCPECHSGNISACQEREEHTQEDLVIIRPLITRYVKKRGYCRDCGALFFPNGPGERPNGYIGPVAVATAGY